MTDAQIIKGIETNNPVVWRHIYRNMKLPFITTLTKFTSGTVVTPEEWEDIFQDASVLLMKNVKEGKFELRPGSSLFSYLVEIGKRTMLNIVRKKQRQNPKPSQKNEGGNVVTPPFVKKGNSGTTEEIAEEISAEERQTEQDRFLDRVFESIPEECKTILKKFYWEHKPMDEIASIMGLKNANTAKTKKNRCMNKFNEIAKKLLANDEFSEELIRGAAERSALREIFEEERVLMQEAGVRMAAFDVEEDENESDK